MILKVKKLNEEAIIPTRATAQSAGYDLYSLQDYSLKKGDAPTMVHSGISIEVDSDFPVAIKLYIRSGLGKKGINFSNGVGLIDQDYRGEVCGLLQNTCNSNDVYTIKKGERFAQLVIEPVYCPEVEEVAELSDTARGEGGFG